MTKQRIPAFNVAAGVAAHRAEIDAAIARVMDAGSFVLGRELEAFEREFATATGTKHAIGVASGTDALHIGLRALGVGPGDRVAIPPITFFATAEAVVHAGATPVFCDVEPDTLTIDPDQANETGANAVIPVHIFGHPADMDRLNADMVIEDACQAHGARYKEKTVGSIGAAGAFSFYPTKNLPAAGDGGMLVTKRADVAMRVRRLRHHGQEQKNVHQEIGYASRLDDLQAAILRVRLRHLDDVTKARRERAAWYRDALKGLDITLPAERDWAEHVYHLFVIRVDDRDRIAATLNEEGIGATIPYAMPAHKQPAAAQFNPGSLPVAERECARLMSLPIYPELRPDDIEAVAKTLKDALK